MMFPMKKNAKRITARNDSYVPRRKKVAMPDPTRRSKMGLYKNGRVWWMDFVYKGKFIRRSTETRNSKQAERIYHKALGAIVEGKGFDRRQEEKITFAEIMEKYMTEHSARNKVAPKAVNNEPILMGHAFDLSIL
jgi:hypothetical protein